MAWWVCEENSHVRVRQHYRMLPMVNARTTHADPSVNQGRGRLRNSAAELTFEVTLICLLCVQRGRRDDRGAEYAIFPIGWDFILRKVRCTLLNILITSKDTVRFCCQNKIVSPRDMPPSVKAKMDKNENAHSRNLAKTNRGWIANPLNQSYYFFHWSHSLSVSALPFSILSFWARSHFFLLFHLTAVCFATTRWLFDHCLWGCFFSITIMMLYFSLHLVQFSALYSLKPLPCIKFKVLWS